MDKASINLKNLKGHSKKTHNFVKVSQNIWIEGDKSSLKFLSTE